MTPTDTPDISPESPEAFFNRELSWLVFAGRVLSLADDPMVPLLERVKFAGILGMLHDEFFMKRISGLKRQVRRGVEKLSLDGRTPLEELLDCRRVILTQVERLTHVVDDHIRPSLAEADIPIRDFDDLDDAAQTALRTHFTEAVLPILTPLAVDAEHPFPFISNFGLNLAVTLKEKKRRRFVRVRVPANRPRWVPLPDGAGVVPLEQVIAANLDQLFPRHKRIDAHLFRVTRGASGEREERTEIDEDAEEFVPGGIISHVADELKARRFAGVVRLEVAADMPEKLCDWLARQLDLGPDDVYRTPHLLGLADLLQLHVEGRPELRDPEHRPVNHPRLRNLSGSQPDQLFAEIRRGDILLHHPYDSFDSSVVRFLEAAAVDPKVLAIKLTIYRTSTDSPIVQALAEAARRGKQVAVLVEITARFDEAPNIAWGRLLEKEGVHVGYGVEKLKTHVKLALVVREEEGGVRRYVHVGTGNYHTVTARLYGDLGLLSCDRDLSADVAAVFNELTSATPFDGYRKLLVAPRAMRDRFKALIRREAEHAGAGRPSGIRARMNQLQDPQLIRELYRASQAGVPITLNVRGLCCLRPGVPGLSETIRVFSVVGRFLEHGRLYRFENGGEPEFFLGSADWMKRNLDSRVETIAPIEDPDLRSQLDAILEIYEQDNATAWDLQPDGTCVRRTPAEGDERRASQEVFMSHNGR